MSQTRRGFTKEFRVDAVHLVTEQGYKVSEAAGNLGISTSVLRRWRDRLEKQADQAFPGKGFRTPEKQELHRLRKEVKRLEMEHGILLDNSGPMVKTIQGGQGVGIIGEDLQKPFDLIQHNGLMGQHLSHNPHSTG